MQIWFSGCVIYSIIREYIGGHVVTETRTIYRVTEKVDGGEDGCNVIYFWWVDQWGRPVNEKSFIPDNVLPEEDMLEEYLNTFPRRELPGIKTTIIVPEIGA